MFKLVLLFLTVSGLHAVPIAVPRGLQTDQLPDAIQSGAERADISSGRGAELSGRFLVDIGRVEEHLDVVRPSLGNGYGEMERRHWLPDEIPDDVPVLKSGGSWVRVEEPSEYHLTDGFRQGTEPVRSNPKGFRQGTEPVRSNPKGFKQGVSSVMQIPDRVRQELEQSFHIPESLVQLTQPSHHIPAGFRQGTEPQYKIPAGFKQGTEPFMSIPEGFRQGTEPLHKIPAGFKQGTEPSLLIPPGFRQGTEPFMSIPDGFRQGTEPQHKIPDGFRQGTERFMSILDGFRQGTEPQHKIPDGFRQGTERFMSIPDGFRQGTEPQHKIPDGFRQGTEPLMAIPNGFRQGTEPSAFSIRRETVACKGEVINGNCYEFNPTPQTFQQAQALCRATAPNAELASVSSSALHYRLVSLVTKGGESNPVLTWLGGVIKNQKASWVDGSEWSYSDWKPDHLQTDSDKPVCLEMFHNGESWWTAADCDLLRASLCAYPVSA